MNPRLLTAAAALSLSACSQAAPPLSNVASLESSGAGTPSTTVTTPSDGEQPRLRMDMTEGDKQRLYDAHTACLAEKDPNATGTGAGPTDMSGTRQRYNDEAWKACAKKWPLPPWEMDSGNPTFKDNWHKNVQCLNSRGVKVIETEPGSWTYDGVQTLPEDQRLKIEKDCEQDVFGGGRK
ncbi:hypothetical protein [Lentzea sp. NBRC 102530]|uniref:hypothetical protein n=1 Tax=Lentzea sp. NBRC 102530 TaxID=3032201 RepID=UPI0024A4992D|nr:hypothetical protein [Lentzea sp. NBRC 102530]GLY46874.1 hypothetical protein Lesp01_05300 [Lentzea sp. NBRC 102530]